VHISSVKHHQVKYFTRSTSKFCLVLLNQYLSLVHSGSYFPTSSTATFLEYSQRSHNSSEIFFFLILRDYIFKVNVFYYLFDILQFNS